MRMFDEPSAMSHPQIGRRGGQGIPGHPWWRRMLVMIGTAAGLTIGAIGPLQACLICIPFPRGPRPIF
jgi:hypothetical protein